MKYCDKAFLIDTHVKKCKVLKVKETLGSGVAEKSEIGRAVFRGGHLLYDHLYAVGEGHGFASEQVWRAMTFQDNLFDLSFISKVML